ncbi:hypothetical protein ACVWWU_000151 [Pantoea sp. PA1]|nr:hypothetical protein [Pantoea ananatis]MDH0053489.1 hypothetical protein [Pantoea ananatis]MDQ1226063.1 hypothetical protein [Pantoea ananatis]MDR6089357.1 hypothetical protein [Pantoea ananatis]
MALVKGARRCDHGLYPFSRPAQVDILFTTLIHQAAVFNEAINPP